MNKKIILVVLIGVAIFLSGCIYKQISDKSVESSDEIPIEEIRDVKFLHVYGFNNPSVYYTVTVFYDGTNKCYVLERGEYSISCVSTRT